MRKCLECQKTLTGHGNRKRCPDCAYTTVKTSTSQWQKNNEMALRYMRLKRRHIEMDPERNPISYQEMIEVLKAPCAYCGTTSNSIDRIDSKQGYITGNCQATCIRCNLMKWQDSEKDFLTHVEKILSYCSKRGTSSIG